MKPNIPSVIDSEKYKKLEQYIPAALSVSPLVGILMSAAVNHARNAVLADAYMRVNAEFDMYKLRVIQATHSNNWLRMHGYPMRKRRRK